MKIDHLFFFSPPFFSHVNPLLTLAKSIARYGKKVTFGCSLEFREMILSAGVDFYEIDISSNKNTGRAEATKQSELAKARLQAFFEATKRGPVETLRVQTQHRKDDMLYDPEFLIKAVERVYSDLKVDMFVVDVLSYGVTLAVYAAGYPFITFCPPHPDTIPDDDLPYGLPRRWPSAIHCEKGELASLEEEAWAMQAEFTQIFNRFIGKYKKGEAGVDNAFQLVSNTAVIYNYQDFQDDKRNKNRSPHAIFMGHCFEERSLDEVWSQKVGHEKMKIMITLGTFLSSRVDVLQRLARGLNQYYPDAVLYVSAGDHVEELRPFISSKDIVWDFLPQIGLLPHMDLIIHHGGCNTFTESLFYGVPMIILPFSSDQFSIASDAESNGLAEVLDPNRFTQAEFFAALERTQSSEKDGLDFWSEASRQKGADYAARMLLKLLDE